MSGPIGVLRKWGCAVAYGLLGVLMGVVLASAGVEVLLLLSGTSLLSAKAAQVTVLVGAAISGLAAAAGYLRHR